MIKTLAIAYMIAALAFFFIFGAIGHILGIAVNKIRGNNP